MSFCDENESIEGQLSAKCYCPGDEYATLIPKLMETIARMGREKSKTAQIQRFPILPKPGIPPLDVLKQIKRFSSYTRGQLLQINHEDLSAVATDARERSMLMNAYANRTVSERIETYEALKAENEVFVQNMTELKPLILEAQELVKNPPEDDAQGANADKRRRKRTVEAIGADSI